MRAVEHNKKFAEKVNIPQSVGRKLVDDDKRAHARNQKKNASSKK